MIVITGLFEIKLGFAFWCLFVLWIIIMGVFLAFNPCKNKEEELDELFKSKISYEEAEKKLGLKYDPPKN